MASLDTGRDLFSAGKSPSAREPLGNENAKSVYIAESIKRRFVYSNTMYKKIAFNTLSLPVTVARKYL